MQSIREANVCNVPADATTRHSSMSRARRRRLHSIAVFLFVIAMKLTATAHAGSTFQGSTFQGSTFQGSTFQGSTFQGSTFQGSTFQGSTFQGSTFQGSTFQGSTFQGSTFQGSTFQGSTFQGSTFQGSGLHAAQATATAPAGSPRQPMRIEISHFAGSEVYGTVLAADGTPGGTRRFHPRDLVGLTWTAEVCNDQGCDTLRHRIAGVAPDTSPNTMPEHMSNEDVWLYHVEYELASDPGRWRNACGEGPPGTAMGLFVDGSWSEDGTWHAGGWTFSCPDGVISKCVRSWGYKPWKTVSSPGCGEVELQPLHRACVRAARADYCGDGISHTHDGTLVDMFDTCGLNVREDVPGFTEESAFDERGALWVSVPRWPTAARTRAGWRFATCERPRQAPRLAAAAMIYVWSDPTKGR